MCRQVREHATLALVVISFSLCHSARIALKLYEVLAVEEYLSQER